MISLITSFFAIAAYLGVTALLIKHVFRNQPSQLVLPLMLSAAALHTISILATWWLRGEPQLEIQSAFSVVAVSAVWALLVTSNSRAAHSLGLLLLPLSALSIGIALIAHNANSSLSGHSPLISFHILCSIVALGLFALATLQAILFSVQESYIKARKQNTLTTMLPPLDAMEAYLFRLLVLSFVLISFALVTGLGVIEDIRAQHLIHKTVLTGLAWFVLAVLLGGRLAFGWRGKTAVRYTVGGYCLLSLGYFGSKFVLEIVLA